jgi:hypothetical protein
MEESAWRSGRASIASGAFNGTNMLIVIEDSIHCERIDTCTSFQEAIERLQEFASLPWDQHPNRAPCVSWHKCGREYQIIEYDEASIPWKVVREADVLRVSEAGVEWVPGFEYAWAELRGEL